MAVRPGAHNKPKYEKSLFQLAREERAEREREEAKAFRQSQPKQIPQHIVEACQKAEAQAQADLEASPVVTLTNDNSKPFHHRLQAFRRLVRKSHGKISETSPKEGIYCFAKVKKTNTPLTVKKGIDPNDIRFKPLAKQAS